MKFYFILSTQKSGKKCGDMILYMGTYKDAPFDFLQPILTSSGRYYAFDGKIVPIAFDYDLQFIGYGKSIRGITRKAPTGELFYIEFSGNDKVISTGY